MNDPEYVCLAGPDASGTTLRKIGTLAECFDVQKKWLEEERRCSPVVMIPRWVSKLTPAEKAEVMLMAAALRQDDA